MTRGDFAAWSVTHDGYAPLRQACAAEHYRSYFFLSIQAVPVPGRYRARWSNFPVPS